MAVIRYMLLSLALAGAPVALPESSGGTRALWVTRWEWRTPDDLRRIVTNAAESRFNTLLLQMRGNGTVFFRSSVEPWAEEFGFQDPGWDPLELATELCHARGLECHAWINVFPGWRGSEPPADRRQLYHTHPDWFICDAGGRRQELNSHYLWLSPTHPRVQQHLIALCTELVERYDIDGLHLDYIRFPGPQYSHDPYSLRLFHQIAGGSPASKPEEWAHWRRESINSFLGDLRRECRALDPGLVLSASVVADHARGRHFYLQDSHGWLARDVVDAIYPMIYTEDNRLFRAQLIEHRYNEHGRHIYPGIMVRSPVQLRDQLGDAMALGASGASLFSYGMLYPGHRPVEALISTLAELWPEKAKPAPMPWKKVASDNQGPVITRVHTIPTSLKPDSRFKIAAQIMDPSGVHDDDSGPEGEGIYLVYNHNWPPIDRVTLKMSPIEGARDWYITDSSIPPHDVGVGFRCRIFAWDDHRIAGGEPQRNMGFSDVWSLAILIPTRSYVYAGTIGPALERPAALVVDSEGKIWTGDREKQSLVVLKADGSQAPFSPLTHGLDRNGRIEPIGRIDAMTQADAEVMCAAVSSPRPAVYRFNLHTGESLPALAIDYRAVDMESDGTQHLYLLEANGNWHVMHSDGLELEGSPVRGRGGRKRAHDLAVLNGGEIVLVGGSDPDRIFCWCGRTAGLQARYRRNRDLSTKTLGISKITLNHSEPIYLSHSYGGLITVMDRDGSHMAHLYRGRASRLAVSATGDTLYAVSTSGTRPTRISTWLNHNPPVFD